MKGHTSIQLRYVFFCLFFALRYVLFSKKLSIANFIFNKLNIREHIIVSKLPTHKTKTINSREKNQGLRKNLTLMQNR